MCLALLMASCASEKSAAYTKKKERSSVTGWNNGLYSLDPNGNTSVNNNNNKEPNLQQDRKVTYNASVEMSPKSADSVNARLMGIAQRYGGYILNTGPQSASIRVRAADLNKALEDIARLGKVKNQRIWGEDVTEEYTDLEIRLDNMKKTRARYLELLQKANNVNETLDVEKELERLSREIDLLEGKLNRLSHLTEYSTIDIRYYSKPKPGPLGYVFIGLYKGVKWLFVRG
jgi:hypothetical protein